MIRGVLFGVLAVMTISAAEAGQVAQSANPASEIQLGRRVFSASCASCHGEKAEGAAGWQKPNQQGELPAPPHDSSGHTWRHSDADLYEMIAKGWRDPFNKTDRLTMPAFAGVLKPEEIHAVIAYLKSLWTDEQRQFQLEKTQETSPTNGSDQGH